MADQAIERLEELLQQETEALRTGAAVDLRQLNGRKAQALHELKRLGSAQLGAGPGRDAEMAARFTRLRSALEANRHMLELHVTAMREITSVMAEAIRAAESDGTYSARVAKPGPRP